MSEHQPPDDEDDLHRQLYAVLCRLLSRQQRTNSAIRSLSSIIKHLEAASSEAGDAEVNLRRAAQALAEYEEASNV